MGAFYHLFKEVCRFFGSHAIGNPLRVFFYRLSGVRVGRNVLLNQGLTIVDDGMRGMIVIEDGVSFAPNVTLVAKSSPMFIHPAVKRESLPIKEGRILIREGVWIGTGAVILPGVTLGKCSMVGANAVVGKDVPDFTIVAGIPAQPLRQIEKR